ncbi:MAG: hypothetical protein ACFFDN_06695 [Candidatus Hodarchaeota archaeon]
MGNTKIKLDSYVSIMGEQTQSSTVKKSKRLPRVRAIETIRGISTFFMVFGHYFHWFYNKESELGRIFDFWIANYSMNHGFPFFIILIGITLSFAIQRRLEKEIPKKELVKYILKRGLIIIVISILMNLVSYITILSTNPLLILDWNVMAMIGLSYMINAFIMVLKPPKLAYGVIGFVLILIDANMPVRVGFHVLANMLIGTLLGSYWIEAVRNDKISQYQRYLLLIGILLFVVTFPIDLWIVFNFVDINNPLVFDILFLASGRYDLFFIVKSLNIIIPIFHDYPWIFNQWIYYLFSIGNFAVLYSVLLYFQDIKKKKWRIFDPIMLIGNISLTLFVTHFLFAVYFFLPLNLYNYFHVLPFIVMGLSLFILIYIITLIWKRKNYKYSLEYFLRG